MSYQNQSQVPKKGEESEQERRIEKTLQNLGITKFLRRQFVCFSCKRFGLNPRADTHQPPEFCIFCGKAFNEGERDLYALPDFIIYDKVERGAFKEIGVILVHGMELHTKTKMRINHDARQYEKFFEMGWLVFVIPNESIDHAFASVLTGWLLTVFRTLTDERLYRALYFNEVEFPKFRELVQKYHPTNNVTEFGGIA